MDTEHPKPKKLAVPPGTLLYTGDKKTNAVSISVIEYDAGHYQEYQYTSAAETFKHKTSPQISWINIEGLHNEALIYDVCQHFGVDILMIEDILNVHQRPKINEFSEYLFLSFRMIGLDQKGVNIESEQISAVMSKTWVITFQEQKGDIYQILRDRLKNNLGKLRKQGADYLLYRILDVTVDYYFYVIHALEKSIEKTEEIVLENFENSSLQKIQKIKKRISLTRKSVFPLREALHSIIRENHHLLSKETINHLKDVHEHIINAQENLDFQKETIEGITELYLSAKDSKMHEIMKVLTIISTLFMPLTFIVGVYGMNFKHMPELQWPLGYPAVWALMIGIVAVLVYYFKKKNWW